MYSTLSTHFRILSCRARSADSTALLPVLAPQPKALADSPPTDVYKPLVPRTPESAGMLLWTPSRIPEIAGLLDRSPSRRSIMVALSVAPKRMAAEARAAEEACMLVAVSDPNVPPPAAAKADPLHVPFAKPEVPAKKETSVFQFSGKIKIIATLCDRKCVHCAYPAGNMLHTIRQFKLSTMPLNCESACTLITALHIDHPHTNGTRIMKHGQDYSITLTLTVNPSHRCLYIRKIRVCLCPPTLTRQLHSCSCSRRSIRSPSAWE